MSAQSILARGTTRLTSGVLTRHLMASWIATAMDFAVMLLLVELAGVRADVATLAGAALGAVINFSLGRTWVYRAAGARTRAQQALRYAAVSATSAGLPAREPPLGLPDAALRGLCAPDARRGSGARGRLRPRGKRLSTK